MKFNFFAVCLLISGCQLMQKADNMTSGDFASLDRVALEKIHGANTDAYIGRLRESFLSLGNEHLWAQVDIETVEKCLLNQHPDFYELPLKQIALCLNQKFFTYSTEKIYSVNDASINTLTSCLQLVESKQLCSMEPWRFHFFLKMPLEKRQIIASSLNHRTLLHLQKPILCDILQRLSPELLELTCDVFGDLLLERGSILEETMRLERSCVQKSGYVYSIS